MDDYQNSCHVKYRWYVNADDGEDKSKVPRKLYELAVSVPVISLRLTTPLTALVIPSMYDVRHSTTTPRDSR